MTCDLADTILHFHESGIKIKPLSIDIRDSRRERDQFDSVQARITREAGDYIIEHNENKEPITIEVGGDHVLYRGYYATDSVQLGRGKSVLKIQDPRRILRGGDINKEWGKASLETVVTYIYNRRIDPKGVISGIRFNDPASNNVEAQFSDLHSESRDANDLGSVEMGIANAIRETIPLLDGDGNFDFRNESPYSALREVTNIWETDWYITRDGTLVIGNSDLNPDVFAASQFTPDMYIKEFNLPQNPTPLKGVYVKGKLDYEGGHDDNITEDIYNWVADKEKTGTRAYAGYTDNDLTETVSLDRKNTADPKALKQIALRGFLKKNIQANRGSLVLDALASEETDTEDFCTLGVGDRLWVPDGWGCEKADPGIYEVHSVHHKINGKDGWSITVKVTQQVTKDVEKKFWYFDPTDPDHTEEDMNTLRMGF